MYTYNEQIEIIDKIHVKEGMGININCPFCGGRKTLGIAIRDGRKMWHCFKLSCGAKGATTIGMSTKALRRRIHSVEGANRLKRLIDIPAHLSAPVFHPAVLHYLEDNNSLEAYQNGLIRVEYAPAERRVLFFSEDERGAVGRSLDGATPKWKQYGEIEGIIRVGDGDVAVVVEDVPSACSVSRFTKCSGCALLGTVLSSQQKAQLCAFTEVIIALDKDASRKAIDLKSKLEGRVKTRVVFLEDDLKWLTGDQIQALLR